MGETRTALEGGCTLRLAGIVRESIVDGPGIRFVVFVQGCPHRCPGCQNAQAQSFEGGAVFTVDQLLQEITKNPLLKGVTFSGGEPFCQPGALAELARRIHSLGMDVMCYTGYIYEDLVRKGREEPEIQALLENCDALVDGPILQEEKSLMLHFRGSRNQRILDLPRSLSCGRAVSVPWQDYPAAGS